MAFSVCEFVPGKEACSLLQGYKIWHVSTKAPGSALLFRPPASSTGGTGIVHTVCCLGLPGLKGRTVRLCTHLPCSSPSLYFFLSLPFFLWCKDCFCVIKCINTNNFYVFVVNCGLPQYEKPFFSIYALSVRIPPCPSSSYNTCFLWVGMHVLPCLRSVFLKDFVLGVSPGCSFELYFVSQSDIFSF